MGVIVLEGQTEGKEAGLARVNATAYNTNAFQYLPGAVSKADIFQAVSFF